MNRRSRVAFSTLAICCIASAAEAVEVAVQLSAVWTRVCHRSHGPPGYSCSQYAPAILFPPAPMGAGVVDLDAAGQLIHGVLTLEAFSVNGVPVPAWSGEVQRGISDSVVSMPGWPTPGGNGSVHHMDLPRFEGQADFSGAFRIVAGNWALELSFASVPGAKDVACPGERLFLDDDGDGKVNGRDTEPGYSATQFGDQIDSEGRTAWEFCTVKGQSDRTGKPSKSCERLDYRNDEPLLRRPVDCRRMTSSEPRCEPAEFLYRSQPPAVVSRTCSGFGVVDDADADGEPDATDRCPSTPRGSLIDGDGCGAEQFCSLQSVQLCGRADFGNDEPLAKKPGDCTRTRSEPRACAAADSN